MIARKGMILAAVLVGAAVLTAGGVAVFGPNSDSQPAPADSPATGARDLRPPSTDVVPTLETVPGETVPGEADPQPVVLAGDGKSGQPAAANESGPFVPLPQSNAPVAANVKKYRQLLPKDAIRPIYEPKFIPGREDSLRWEDLVIGVELNGESRAYPVGPLNFREMVNDVVGGVPILVTW